jgi:membrane protein
MQVGRERILRSLTFWLRPDFVLRCLRRFQQLEGFDRAIALASLAFSALIPLSIVLGGAISDKSAGQRIVDRFGLEGNGAQAVIDLFARGEDLKSGFSLFSFFFLIVAVLSFSRALQRLFERTWDLSPLSVRNTLNGLKWIGGLIVYVALTGFVRTEFDSGVLEVLTSVGLGIAGVAFVLWSGMLLTNRRVTTRQLLPGAILIAVAATVVGIGGDIYVPRLFNSYAARYGSLGAVFALISWLFVGAVALVGATAVGREVWAEMESIRRGDRPSNAQIEAEWAAFRAQVDEGRAVVSERAQTVRARWRERREARRR